MNAEKKTYTVRKASGKIKLSCDETIWAAADRLSIDEYPWYTHGQKQATTVAALYDADAIYLLFICEDKHIYAVETRPNGDVYKDSCVEFFANVDPEKGDDYFNFEANCCGTIHLAFGPDRYNRTLASGDVLEKIRVSTSIPTATKEESPSDDGWWLAAKIPFSAISKLAGYPVEVKSGTIWTANFYRCGGKTDPQHACWNPIATPQPDFHQPGYFGILKFE